jgi:beta-N-acetylhexosaminidase
VCTYNGHLFPGQRALVQALGALGIPMAQVALRNPYDLRCAPEGAAAVAAWDYAGPTLEALVPILSGEAIPTGRMPVALEGRV